MQHDAALQCSIVKAPVLANGMMETCGFNRFSDPEPSLRYAARGVMMI
jgi:hypothetical protein